MPQIERGGIRDIVEVIDGKVDQLILGGNYCQADDLSSAVTDEPVDFGVKLFTDDGEPLDEAQIAEAGTYAVYRIRGGVTQQIVPGTVPSTTTGRVYAVYNFPAVDWTPGDLFWVRFSGIVADGKPVPTQIRYGAVTLDHSVEQVYQAVLAGSGEVVQSREMVEAYMGRQRLQNPEMEKALGWSAQGTAVLTYVPFRRRGTAGLRVVAASEGDGAYSNAFENPDAYLHFAEAWVYHAEAGERSFALRLRDAGTGAFGSLTPAQDDVTVQPNTWTRIFGTFASTGASGKALAVTCVGAAFTFYVDSAYVARISNDELYTLLDAIRAKTDNLPAQPAAVGSAMTLAPDALNADALAASAVAEIQAGLATAAALAVVDGVADAALAKAQDVEADTQDIQNRLTTAQNDLTTLKGYTDILDDGTNGNAAIKTAVASGNALAEKTLGQVGRNLIDNPSFAADLTGWVLSNGSGTAAMVRDTGTWRSGGASCKLDGTNSDSIRYDSNNNRAKGGRVYVSAWFYAAEADVPIKVAPEYCSPASVTGVTAANAWVRLEGIFTYSSNAYQHLRLFVGLNAAAGAKTVYIDDVVAVYLDESYHDFYNRFKTSKSAALGYDRSTDSLEALRDRLDEVYGQAAAVADGKTVRAVYDKVVQQKVNRDAQSGTTTMNGTEQTLFEVAGTTPWEFKGGLVDLSGLADTRSVTIRVYVKVKNGGTYRKISELALAGAANAFCYPVPQSIPIGGSDYKMVLPGWWNVYGVKVTAQQTVQGGGYLSVDHEWFRSEG